MYAPPVDRDEARSNVIDDVVSRFFDNSPRELVLQSLDSQSIDEREGVRLRALLDAAAPATR